MNESIEIRAHHLLCISRFYRGGYNEKFAQNMKEICIHIRKRPEIKVKILVGKLDALCHECPRKFQDSCVQSKKIGKWVVSQDEKVANFLDIKPNSIFDAKEIFNLSLEKVNENTIKSVCAGCIFLSNCIKVGINNSFKKDLNKN
ncbi:DUF1284 domain-containing protein [Nanoarchaeota archaeon]